MCTFCPQDALKSSYGKGRKYLSFDDFQTILSKVPKHVRIDFSGMAEPWANPETTDMLRLTLERGYNVAIYTTLYGMSLVDCQAVCRMLFVNRDQVEIVCLHLPDKNGNMRGWKVSDDYKRNLARFLEMGKSLRNFEVMTMDGSGEVHPSLGNIRTGRFYGHTRAGNVTSEDVDGQEIHVSPLHSTPVMCAFTPFYDQNVVLPNGDVMLCCMDYGTKHRLGNLLENSYYEIFSGGALAELRAENMRPEFSDRSLCRTCNRAKPLRTGVSKQFWQS